MYALGKGTVWCVASGEKEQARQYYDSYSFGSNFYIAIKKNLGEQRMLEVAHGANHDVQAMIYPYWDKIAIQVFDGGGVTYWNTGDFNHEEGSEELSEVNLPEYKFKFGLKIPSDWKLNENGTYDVDDNVYILDCSNTLFHLANSV